MPDIYDLLQPLRYQILTPRVTTFGPCSEEGCEQVARGGATCSVCLTEKLVELTEDPERVKEYVEALRFTSMLLHDLEEQYDTLMEKYG